MGVSGNAPKSSENVARVRLTGYFFFVSFFLCGCVERAAAPLVLVLHAGESIVRCFRWIRIRPADA